MADFSTTDITDITSELKGVESELKGIESQIEHLLAKQSRLQEKRNDLKMRIKLAADLQKSAFDWSSESFSWSDELKDKSRAIFGISDFRPLQLETMNSTLSKIDCILIIPTGAGKSLCYQLPSLLEPGVTLVISPLVSLMEDQLMAMEKIGVTASMLSADTPKEIMNRVYSEIGTRNKTCDLKLLYVTPEKLAKSKRFMNKLEDCYKRGLLSRIAIDEVHCCSHWGHDFRPDYKFLGILKRQFPKTPILGLTATASTQIIVDVQKILQIPEAAVFRGSFNRPNLNYCVEMKPANHSACMDQLAQLITENYSSQSGIIYCFSRKDTVTISEELNKRDIKSAFYHADMDSKSRSSVHHRWVCNKVHVIVATIAFGMGIDKPDVRFVIHHSMSKSIENYYQESGRAGRDGSSADCILLYRLADLFRQSCMVFTESSGLEKLYNILSYCLSFNNCRRELLAPHFSESWKYKSCQSMCDHCKGLLKSLWNDTAVESLVQAIKMVYDILDKAKDRDERLTGQKTIDALLGKGPTQNRVKGGSTSLSRDQCEYLIGCMIAEGCIREDFHFTPYSTIAYLVTGSKKTSLKTINTLTSTPETSQSLKRKSNDVIHDKKKTKKSSQPSTSRSTSNSQIIVID